MKIKTKNLFNSFFFIPFLSTVLIRDAQRITMDNYFDFASAGKHMNTTHYTIIILISSLNVQKSVWILSQNRGGRK